jgi:hypothetical protein
MPQSPGARDLKLLDLQRHNSALQCLRFGDFVAHPDRLDGPALENQDDHACVADRLRDPVGERIAHLDAIGIDPAASRRRYPRLAVRTRRLRARS